MANRNYGVTNEGYTYIFKCFRSIVPIFFSPHSYFSRRRFIFSSFIRLSTFPSICSFEFANLATQMLLVCRAQAYVSCRSISVCSLTAAQ